MLGESDSRVSSWFSQMADALRAGHSPSEAASLARGISSKTTSILVQRFEAGDGWEHVLEGECRFLSDSELSILVAASRSGGLPESMEMLAKAREFRMRSRRLMVLGLLYPLALLHFAIAIVPAQRLMDGAYANYVVSVLMILFPLWIFLFLGIIASKLFPAALGAALRFLPLLRGYAKLNSIALFANVLSASLRSGARIDEAWDLASRAAQSPQFTKLGGSVCRAILNGEEVGPLLSRSSWLPDDVLSGYRTAERSGNLEDFLMKLSLRYADKAMTRLKVAIGGYTGLFLLVAMGFAAWRIVSFYAGYFQRIQDLAS